MEIAWPSISCLRLGYHSKSNPSSTLWNLEIHRAYHFIVACLASGSGVPESEVLYAKQKNLPFRLMSHPEHHLTIGKLFGILWPYVREKRIETNHKRMVLEYLLLDPVGTSLASPTKQPQPSSVTFNLRFLSFHVSNPGFTNPRGVIYLKVVFFFKQEFFASSFF